MSAFDNLPQSAAVRDDRISAPSQVPNPEPYTDTEKDFQPPVRYETSDEELDIRKTYARPVAERRHLYAGVADDARSQNDRKTIVPPQPGLDGERTHQEPSSPTVAAIPVDRNWHPQQMYNPESVMPVFPTLPRIFGDVRDDSPARIQWNAKLASGIAPNEVMERITGLFGMESFKQHCLDLYERLIALPTRTRLEKAGILDLSLTGSEGCGNNLAALRYRELLVTCSSISAILY
ncbi:hypothetical protein SEUCBS139899_006030 [Sporothrix eucalyptigena]